MEYHTLPRSFYLRDTVTVARDLLGKYLVHIVDGELRAAKITETEAYTGVNDRACHSYGGKRTPRTETMYLAGGHSYVYLIYGMYDLFNVVTEGEGVPCAVLIRGAVPVSGHDAISRARCGKPWDTLTPRRQRSLMDGPGKLCRGLGLTRKQNAQDLLGNEIYITNGDGAEFEIGVGKRIGVDYAGEDANLPYRFFIPL